MTSSPFFGHEEDRARQYLEDGRRRLEELGSRIRKPYQRRHRTVVAAEHLREQAQMLLDSAPLYSADVRLLARIARGEPARPCDRRRVEYLIRRNLA